MGYSEDDLLPLSALQHLLFCERQCALIHIEQAWSENRFTAEGRIMHERVDSGGRESRGAVRLAYGLALHSFRLGLVGKADVVEFHLNEAGTWQPFPVEHKRGRAKKENWARVQLCAQAICLEEMLGTAVPAGALFYGKSRRRQGVDFDAELRAEVERTAKRLHALIRSGKTPPAYYDEKKCESCSLINLCMPRVTGARRSAQKYVTDALATARE